jgi:hypothetical protein
VKLSQRFLSHMGGRVAADVDLAALSLTPRLADGPRFVTENVMTLPLADREDFLESWQGDWWKLLLVAHSTHPNLLAITSWVAARDDVLLLVTPAGPEPPAVYCLDR